MVYALVTDPPDSPDASPPLSSLTNKLPCAWDITARFDSVTFCRRKIKALALDSRSCIASKSPGITPLRHETKGCGYRAREIEARGENSREKTAKTRGRATGASEKTRRTTQDQQTKQTTQEAGVPCLTLGSTARAPPTPAAAASLRLLRPAVRLPRQAPPRTRVRRTAAAMTGSSTSDQEGPAATSEHSNAPR